MQASLTSLIKMKNKSASTFLFQLVKRKRGTLSLLFLLIFISSSSYAEERVIRMAVSQSISHSGILSYFIPLFEKRMPYRIKAMSASNEEAISMGREGKADLLFIKASDHSEEFISEGFGINKWNVMHNFSVIIGPKNDPARIEGRDPVGALKKIAKGKFTFISCISCEDLQNMERRLWEETGIKPAGEWYIGEASDLSGVLMLADSRSAYTLSDRVAYLKLKEKTRLNLLVDRHPLLFNQYIIIEVNPKKFPLINNSGGKAFAEFVTSGEGEDIIRRFGLDRYREQVFFPQ